MDSIGVGKRNKMITKYNTEKRDKVLFYLKKFSKKAVTVSEIMDYLQSEGIEMSKDSVVRYLDRLCQQNTIVMYRTELGNKTVYQYLTDEYRKHEHLCMQCVRCGKITPMDHQTMNEIYTQIENKYGYELLFQNSFLYGVCKECADMGGIRSEDK